MLGLFLSLFNEPSQAFDDVRAIALLGSKTLTVNHDVTVLGCPSAG